MHTTTRYKFTHIPKSNQFNIHYKNLFNDNLACGGAVNYIHKSIQSTELVLYTTLQAVASTIHSTFKFTICNVYLPNSTNYSKNDLLQLISQLPKPYILLGDFNCHNPIWGSDKIDSKGQIVETIVNDLNLSILNTPNSHTHFTTSSGNFSSIDLTISTPNIQANLHWKPHDDLCSSDHFPLIIGLPSSEIVEKRKKWALDTADWRKLLTAAIISAASMAVQRTSTLPKRKPVPWWSQEIYLAIKQRKKVFRTFHNYPTNANLENFRLERAKCRRLIVEAKKNSFKEFVATINSNTPVNLFWKKINIINGHYSSYEIKCIESKNSIVTEKSQIANELRAHLSSSFSTQLYSKNFIDYIQTKQPLTLSSSQHLELPYNNLFSIEELEISLNKAKGSSPGPDEVHYAMLKHLSVTQKIQLLKFYNHIYISHTFPKSWKETLIVPILKPGKDPKQPSSYRPISLSSCISKTMQRMVSSRLMFELQKRNLLINQFGFLKYLSAQVAHIYLEKIICAAFRRKEHAAVLFFDIEKAYDRTWTNMVLETLTSWGFCGNMMQFITNFMEGRTFKMLIGNIKSNLFTPENGIPQGEILSVSLFLVAMNSVSYYIPKNVEFLLYADGLTIII